MVGIWHLACQTYALNLIDSQGGQSRSPQLFSSSKSFRVAKSTPSSGSLPPISKRLSKPPLLSKSALFFAPLLLLSYTQGIQALTAQTSREIKGSAPYLTFDGGRTKITTIYDLLTITLPDGTKVGLYPNTSSPTNPLIARNVRRINDIGMYIPSSTPFNGYSYIAMFDDIVNRYGYWGDDDGDGQVTASGRMWATFSDKDGNDVLRNDILDACKAPYKITIGADGGLATRYGIPNNTYFGRRSVDYYIKPDGGCYFVQSVRPNLNLGTGNFAGPSNIWNSTKGFLVQSTSPSSYDQNFPTTGADGLYFDLDIDGGDASQLRWSTVSHGGITATVSWVKPRTDSHQNQWENNMQHDTWISDKSKYVTRVTLTGPRASSTQINSSNPSPLNKPILPQTFELEGRNSSGNVVVKYGFVLKQWFVNRGTQYKPYNEQLAWCNRLGYRLSRVRDLTNSNYRNLGASPRSSSNNYMRHIGAGFFTEWGYMSQYADADFILNYWTSDSVNSSEPFIVLSLEGLVKSRAASMNDRGLCTTP